jgi:hypothetical protein
MVFLDVGVLALGVGLLVGGRFANLANTRIRLRWLAFAAIGLQVLAFPSELLPWSTPTPLAKGLWLVSYALLIALLVANRTLTGAPIIGAGLLCNLVAILANGGLMPVRRAALAETGRDYHVHNNSIQLGHPHLAFLVDRWGAPHWLPLANVYSIGDLVIALGTFVAIVAAMRRETAAPELATA